MVPGSNHGVNTKNSMQVHPADEVQIGRKVDPGFHYQPPLSLIIMLVSEGNIEIIRTSYAYANMKLINYNPKHQCEDSNNQYKNESGLDVRSDS
ncbi:unnamed protein product [Schistosoma curassoni]|uniref:Reverse transcriptase domain-containing protein n=1 Tax=Schistosoma curassoni TaxID=6186 RepID=A0A183L3X8_9TREM|nr:unnamed protein product [Schistosoma curassoni]